MRFLSSYRIKKRVIHFPIYFPDATLAVVKSIDSMDLVTSKIEGLVVNTYHLMSQPGWMVLKKFGGIKKYMGWNGLIVSDSGGFQLLTLIYRNQLHRRIDKEGITFTENNNKKMKFTPEISIQGQFDLGADIMICLDDFTPPHGTEEQKEQSVERTIEWAKRCKNEFEHQIEKRKLSDTNRPILIAVIQGGDNKKLREKCGRELIKIGFDGYGFGGWPLNSKGELDLEILKFTADLMEINKPKFALGVGTPDNIIQAFHIGYTMFDCVLPTRDARHKRLYVFTKNPGKIDISKEKKIYYNLFIHRKKYAMDERPISEFCDCHTCKNYSRAYLYHLFEIKDATAGRLATIHNLRTYSKLIELLRKTLQQTKNEKQIKK